MQISVTLRDTLSNSNAFFVTGAGAVDFRSQILSANYAGEGYRGGYPDMHANAAPFSLSAMTLGI